MTSTFSTVVFTKDGPLWFEDLPFGCVIVTWNDSEGNVRSARFIGLCVDATQYGPYLGHWEIFPNTWQMMCSIYVEDTEQLQGWQRRYPGSICGI